LVSSGDGPWSRGLRQASLVATSLVATGAAAMAFLELWRRSQQSRGKGDRRPRSGRGIHLSEVAKHDSLDDAWLVINDQVYNITPFIEDHPGGKWLLLAFAGSDGTKAFESMGHSAVARKQLRALHLGSLQVGTIWKKDAQRTIHHGRSVELTGGPASAEAEPGSLWEVSGHGFLPTRDPVGVEALEHTPFSAFVELADFLPSLGFTGQLRHKIDTDKDLQARMLKCAEPEVLDALSEDQMERAFAAVTYTMMAYWRGGTLDYSMGLTANRIESAKDAAGGNCAISEDAETLPPCLSRPVLALSKILGRPPMIDYASSVLYNWERIDKDGPISMDNTRCVFRLTGLIDEEWFFKTHVIIEAEATHVVSAILAACRALDDSELLTQLLAMEEALWRVVRACLPIMYERVEDGTPKCSEQIFYQILRPLIKSGPLTFDKGEDGEEKVFLSGPSGAMSSLLPCIDAALGIKMTSEKLQQAMSKFKLSMPKRHQEFLSEIGTSMSIRQRILLGRPAAGEQSEHYDALVRSFNRVISRVLDFRWQHWQYVKNFVMKPGNISHAVGTGGTSFDYLQQHITDTEKARLKERFENQTRVATPGDSHWPPTRVPNVAHHPRNEFWSVDGENGLLSREPLVSPPKSSWASSMTPAMLTAFEAAWDIASRLPAICVAEGPVVELCMKAAPKLAPLQDDRALIRLSEVAREHLMTTLSHIAAGCTGVGTGDGRRRKPPSCIEKPLRVVARSVGRPPRLDFTELVLCNWDFTTKASHGITQETCANGDAAQHNLPQLHVVWRFIGAPDEEWYRSIHIVMHREARDIISAIRVGHVAMLDQNDGGVVGSLEQISTWLNKFCDYFDSHFETKGSRTETVMMRRLEPFISRGNVVDLTWEETASWVYCSGSSVLSPAIHAFLGVDHCPRDASPEAERILPIVRRTFEEGRVCMPRNHIAFLEALEKPGVSIRQYCFRRFGAKLVSVEVLHELEVAYNDVLNALGRFGSRRVHLVSRFFPQFASNFGTLHADYEAQQRGERLQLLKMRQRVSRRLER